jgi:hypothetical protein
MEFLRTTGILYTMRDMTVDKMVVFNFQDPFVGL